MATALIGYTGFVGSNLLAQTAFDDVYNRTNIEAISGKNYDLVVCAGVQAAKWWANQNAKQDLQGIAALQERLCSVRARMFVLLSTIDVYTDCASGADEEAPPPLGGSPYGKHRLEFEAWVSENFAATMIVRLPGLFGRNLKKNIIFDLLTGNQLENIDPGSIFQWYDVGRLWRDIGTAMQAGLRLVHLMPEPLSTARILSTCFPGATVGPAKAQSARYDIRTRNGVLFGGNERYIATSSESLQAVETFCNEVRAGILPVGTVMKAV